MDQHPVRYNEIFVRMMNSAPADALNDIRNLISSLDPDLALRDLQSAGSAIDRANYPTAAFPHSKQQIRS